MPKSDRSQLDYLHDPYLAARAAWLYYSGSLLQVEVARKLGLSVNKVNRLLAYAERQGIVRTQVEGPIALCMELEQQISARFSLKTIRIVPEIGESDLPLHELSQAAALVMHAVLEQAKHRNIGIGHGRTLAAMSGKVPERRSSNVQFIALLGALPCRLSTYPFEAINRLTDRTGSTAFLLPVPLYAETARDRNVMMRQTVVKRTLERGHQASLHFIGIGNLRDKELTDLKMGSITKDDLSEVRRAGAVGEILGCYFDANGRKLPLSLHDRVIALPPEALKGKEAIGIAGGTPKAEAIFAILRTGLLSGLITTERTAQKILSIAESR